MGEITASVVTLTPDMARDLLDMNKSNRRVKEDHVRKISEDILAGRYALNGEAILIAEDGSLNDGQHRCLAVIRADRPVQTIIVKGLTRDSRFTVDTGSKRSAGDVLSLKGVAYSYAVAAACNYYLSLQKRGYFVRAIKDGPSLQQTIALAMSDPRFELFAKTAHYRFINGMPRGLMIAVFVHLSDHAPLTAVEEFALQWMRGANADSAYVRKAFERCERWLENLSRNQLAYGMIDAFNGFVAKRRFELEPLLEKEIPPVVRP